MALSDLIATDADRLSAKDRKIEELRELLRDVYDVARAGEVISPGLLARIARQAAMGRSR